MKTFEELKKDKILGLNGNFERISRELMERTDMLSHEKLGREMAINDIRNWLNNIEEYTYREVLLKVNELIYSMKEFYSYYNHLNMSEAHQLTTSAFGGGNINQPIILAFDSCQSLGIDANDLVRFFGTKNPNLDEDRIAIVEQISSEIGVDLVSGYKEKFEKNSGLKM